MPLCSKITLKQIASSFIHASSFVEKRKLKNMFTKLFEAITYPMFGENKFLVFVEVQC